MSPRSPLDSSEPTRVSRRRLWKALSACFPAPVLAVGMGVIALLIGIQTWSASQFTKQALYETESSLNRNIARGLAEKLRPLSERAAPQMISQRLDELATVNPSVRLYLVNTRGIITASPQSYGRVAMPFIDLTPVKNSLRPQDGQDGGLGDDPHFPSRRVPFSVATVRVGGDPGYLYAVTANESLQSSFMSAANKTVALTTFVGAVGSTVVVMLLVGLLFYRRLKALSTALAVLSHDLRGPLTSIQGSLETIMEKGHVSAAPEAQRFVQIALRSTKSAASMLNDLHHLSSIGATEEEVLMEPLSIEDLLMDMVIAVRGQSEEKGITISVSQPSSLPLVQGNLELLERLVRNVLDNAIRYSPTGGRIDVSLISVPEKIRVTILDNGPGIAGAELNSVTRRFVRGSRTQHKVKGTGIGLSVAEDVARIHGSNLRVLSREGEGTAVIFELFTARQANNNTSVRKAA